MPSVLVDELPDAAGWFDDRTTRRIDSITAQYVKNGERYTDARRYAVVEVLRDEDDE